MTELVQFRGVQNPRRGGANAPPLLFLSKPCPVRLPRNTRLTIGRGVQGGSSLNCIILTGKGDKFPFDLIQSNEKETAVKVLEIKPFTAVSFF